MAQAQAQAFLDFRKVMEIDWVAAHAHENDKMQVVAATADENQSKLR
jgi:hypothetical protein